MKHAVQRLHELGQSIWYDNISRTLLERGELKAMIQDEKIRGVTSNPSIFNKAIGTSDVYEEDISALAAQGLDREEVYEALAIEDIQRAADLFRPLYDETEGGDGYVSLEVSPYLARDTEATLEEAKRLWKTVDRPNLMVKIPGTKEGLPAITQAVAAGINVNITLLFSIDRYREVMDAYLSGLEKRLEDGEPIDSVASVASFFISRIETKADQRLQAVIEKGNRDPDRAGKLLGKIAVASGKLAFEAYQAVFSEDHERFAALQAQGANVQRLLWASTSTKNDAYSDVKYVEELIGPGTINTMPERTLQAFLDHGKAAVTVDQNVHQAHEALEELAALGIDIRVITRELVDEGVQKFADSFTALLETIETRLDD
jgi:transaldolase